MDKLYRKVDLHTHTIFSDGYKSPMTLVDMAKKQGVDVLSITDHDSVVAYHELERHKSKIAKRILLVPGIEFTASISSRGDIHMLGYGVDYNNSGILDIQTEVRRKQILKKDIFNNILFDYSLGEVADILDKREGTGYGLRNYNFYDLIKIYGVDEATFKIIKQKYKESIKFIDSIATDAPQIIDIIHQAGGYAIFAHPGGYKWNSKEMLEATEYLRKYGVDGIEVFHPDNDRDTQILLSALCADHSLLMSGGSDYHGSIFSRSKHIIGAYDEIANSNVQSLNLIDKLVEEEKGFEI